MNESNDTDGVTVEGPVCEWFDVRTDSGDYDLQAKVGRIGSDLVVCVWGGDQPHVGAVAIGQARPSLKNEGKVSSTTSVFCLLGHKEDEVVKKISDELASEFSANVVVTAGMRWRDFGMQDLILLDANCERLIRLIVDELSDDSE